MTNTNAGRNARPVRSSTLEFGGCRLAYDVAGDGPPVVLIQGVGVHGGGWQPQVAALESHYQCLTFDHRGLNRSQPVGPAVTIEQMAADTLALMDTQGWASAHIIGHSMGGLIAQQLALSARPRVRSLTLLCTFACGRQATALSPGMIWTGLRTRIGTRRQRRHAFLELVMPPAVLGEADRDALAAQLASLFGHDLADQPSVTIKQLTAMSRCDTRPRLGELAHVPTLVISAFHDRIAQRQFGQELASAIPNARYVEIAEAAHGLPLHLADVTNRLLLAHLDQAEAKVAERSRSMATAVPPLNR
jgi:pimeloyl-ACP methyl ester carboxylesterase